jgi:hypothetical protein
MSKLKILYNFNDNEDKEPVELNEFLQDKKNQLKMYDKPVKLRSDYQRVQLLHQSHRHN